MFEASTKARQFDRGQTIEGTIVALGHEVAFVNVGGKGEAEIDLAELKDADGNVELTHSISAGLDYASVGPEHAWLRETGRAEYTWVDDEAALAAFQRLGREEGILPALESSHAIAHACRLAPSLPKDAILMVNLSGRGDKDVISVQAALEGGR